MNYMTLANAMMGQDPQQMQQGGIKVINPIQAQSDYAQAMKMREMADALGMAQPADSWGDMAANWVNAYSAAQMRKDSDQKVSDALEAQFEYQRQKEMEEFAKQQAQYERDLRQKQKEANEKHGREKDLLKYRAELEKEYSPDRRDGRTGQTLSTDKGMYEYKNGQWTLMRGEDGQPLKAPAMYAYDPTVQEELSRRKKTGEMLGQSATQAKIDLPSQEADAQTSVKLIDKAIKHPGRKTATGLSGVLDPRNYKPGSDAYNFNVLRKQISSKNFLDARQMLKGGGSITDFESKKAEEAAARLDAAQSDEEFLASLQELRDAIQAGTEKLKVKAGSPPELLDPSSRNVSDDDLVNFYLKKGQ